MWVGVHTLPLGDDSKQVFSASSVTKILELSATSEVVGAIESAVSRGIMTIYGDFATNASWWRNTEGILFATHAKAIAPDFVVLTHSLGR